jgi:hypothetical protein
MNKLGICEIGKLGDGKMKKSKKWVGELGNWRILKLGNWQWGKLAIKMQKFIVVIYSV